MIIISFALFICVRTLRIYALIFLFLAVLFLFFRGGCECVQSFIYDGVVTRIWPIGSERNTSSWPMNSIPSLVDCTTFLCLCNVQAEEKEILLVLLGCIVAEFYDRMRVIFGGSLINFISVLFEAGEWTNDGPFHNNQKMFIFGP